MNIQKGDFVKTALYSGEIIKYYSNDEITIFRNCGCKNENVTITKTDIIAIQNKEGDWIKFHSNDKSQQLELFPSKYKLISDNSSKIFFETSKLINSETCFDRVSYHKTSEPFIEYMSYNREGNLITSWIIEETDFDRFLQTFIVLERIIELSAQEFLDKVYKEKFKYKKIN